MSVRSIGLSAILITLVAVSLGLNGLSAAFAGDVLDDFIWQTRGDGDELALSRDDEAINFFDVGDLATHSLPLVGQMVNSLAEAAHIRVERTPAQASSIAIFHDTKVFLRVAADKRAFSAVGIPDNVISTLARQVTDDDPKCLTMTVSDSDKNIRLTVILVSQANQFERCLTSGLLNSFGVATRGVDATDVTDHDLVSACIVHEGRRLGFRDRKSLSQQAAPLQDRCMAKLGLR